MPTDDLLQSDHGWLSRHGHRLDLIVGEAVAGLLGTCRPLDIPGRELASGNSQESSWNAVKIPSAANLRSASDHACRHVQKMGGHAKNSDVKLDECVRRFLEIAVMHAFAPRNASIYGRAVYEIGRVGADAVCTLFSRGVRADFASATTADGVSCGVHKLPALAFRWLKPTPDWTGPHLFVPRHPQGHVMMSDKFRFIFVHIPNVASMTIQALLLERGGIDNLVYSNLAAYKTATYLTFAFVRDPLRRFIASYDELCLKLGYTCAFFDQTSQNGLRNFLAYTRTHPCWDEHVCDQRSFLFDDGGRNIRLDVIASTQHHTDTMMHISDTLAFDPPLSAESMGAHNKDRCVCVFVACIAGSLQRACWCVS
jgi:hypothetical protein